MNTVYELDRNCLAIAIISIAILSWKTFFCRQRWKLDECYEWRQLKNNISIVNSLSTSTDGPIIDVYNPSSIKTILHAAQQRALKSNLNQDLIKQSSPMKSQVGGISNDKKLILSVEQPQRQGYARILLKPLQNNHRGLREVSFYEIVACANKFMGYESGVNDLGHGRKIHRVYRSMLNILLQIMHKYLQTKCCNEIHQLCALNEFLVDYHGLIGHDLQYDQVTCATKYPSYILVSDETEKYTKPCIMDLKVGTETFEPNAESSKKEKQMKKYPQQQLFGFRIVGLHVYDPYHPDANHDGYRMIDKLDGRQLNTKDSIKQTICMFFKLDDSNNAQHKRELIEAFLMKLMRLRIQYQRIKSFSFYASSLLLAYEGTELSSQSQPPRLKMIDFAHVTKCSMNDAGYLFGLDQIINLFLELKERV